VLPAVTTITGPDQEDDGGTATRSCNKGVQSRRESPCQEGYRAEEGDAVKDGALWVRLNPDSPRWDFYSLPRASALQSGDGPWE
jgi:hypothetical protein